jgi:hypothetical protein
MPCHSNYDPVRTVEVRAQGDIIHIDNLTRWLCEANRIIDAMLCGDTPERSAELLAWWEAHQEFDRSEGR